MSLGGSGVNGLTPHHASRCSFCPALLLCLGKKLGIETGGHLLSCALSSLRRPAVSPPAAAPVTSPSPSRPTFCRKEVHWGQRVRDLNPDTEQTSRAKAQAWSSRHSRLSGRPAFYKTGDSGTGGWKSRSRHGVGGGHGASMSPRGAPHSPVFRVPRPRNSRAPPSPCPLNRPSS